MTDNCRAGRELLANALELDAETIGPDASIDTVETWDSIAHMRLILTIEERLQRSLGPAEVADIFSVRDIDQLLKAPQPAG